MSGQVVKVSIEGDVSIASVGARICEVMCVDKVELLDTDGQTLQDDGFSEIVSTISRGPNCNTHSTQAEVVTDSTRDE